MALALTVGALLCAVLLSLTFSTLTYSLRGFSRAKLSETMEKAGKRQWIDSTLEQADDLIFLTAAARLLANLLIFVAVQHLLRVEGWTESLEDLIALALTAVITLFCSVAIPHALADHGAERFIMLSVVPLHAYRRAVLPFTRLMHGVDRAVRKLAGRSEQTQSKQLEEEIEQEILSAVEEGAKEGVVDEQERELIVSAIAFTDETVAKVMTARTDVIGISIDADVKAVQTAVEDSGHSRLPVYEGTLDKVVGVLYTRDLIRFLGKPTPAIDIRSAMRPPCFAPETKTLRDLLHDFRAQKTHIAIVLDEYGGTAGLVTIEDLMEELVGELADDHTHKKPAESAMIKRLDARTAEVDARVYLEELNRSLNLDLPENAGYDTLGGFVSTTLGKIPQKGTTFDFGSTKFTVLDSEPQKVNRVKIELAATATADAGV
jgi:CBS domain containing-hemolysin-like protein